MESHNHPSFIEPFQGAATGVGGILRDIFTMGARPIALADYLCFGEPSAARMRSLLRGVVHGISSYGNCVGVPNVTGQTESEPEYNKNILVNAMAVGLLTPNMRVTKSSASGPGNFVVYVGAKTGKDGIHGASMASESFGENSEAKKPNVQIGDPFFEKLLIEACLEMIEQDLVVAMQDMGAAGLTSSTFEMSAKGRVGFKLNLATVPLRDSSLSPEDILLSESQERMLLICEPNKYSQLEKIFHRWGLDAAKIGVVTKDSQVELWWNDEKLLSIDPNLIIEGSPRYSEKERPFDIWDQNTVKSEIKTYGRRESESDFKIKAMKVRSESELTTKTGSGTEFYQNLKKLYSQNSGAPKTWITKQYDQRVGLRTARGSSSSCAVLRLPSGRGLSILTGCRPFLMKINTRLGAVDSVMYPALQMAVKGSRLMAITDCLNFGNPEKKSVMTDFVVSVEAIAEMSQLLDAPVVSGNVSFYNETLGENIIPTPATGLVGLRPSVAKIPEDFFQQPDEKIFCLRCTHSNADFDGGVWSGQCQSETLSEWKIFYEELLEGSSFFSSSRVCGKYGLWGTLVQMSLSGEKGTVEKSHDSAIGFEVSASESSFFDLCFSKTPLYEVVVSVSSENMNSFQEWVRNSKSFSCHEVGKTAAHGNLVWNKETVMRAEALELKNNSWSQVWGI